MTQWTDEIAATADVPAQALTPDSRLDLVELSIVEQDGAYIVGDREQGTFVRLPRIGVTVIERLRTRASIAEVAATFRAAPGPDDQDTDAVSVDVDVLDFAHTLLDLGFIKAVDGVAVPGAATDEPRRRWITGPRPERIGWLFGRIAWVVYASLFVGCAAVEAVAPSYRPHAGDFLFLGDPLASIAILTVVSFVVVGGHECFHWLAGCAQGIGARFAIGRRLYFLVFETDLTQLWSLPRRRRYGPLLAGMAFDTVVLATTIVGRMLIADGAVTAPPTAKHLLSAVAVLVTTNLAWQFCVFMRNDLYLVLSTRLGCVNLWQVSMLLIKRTLWRLSPTERDELADADDSSRRHARWYSWVCVAGVIGAGWYAAYIMAPVFWHVVRSLADRLGTAAVTSPGFWEAAVFGALALLPLILTLYVAARDIRARRSGV